MSAPVNPAANSLHGQKSPNGQVFHAYLDRWMSQADFDRVEAMRLQISPPIPSYSNKDTIPHKREWIIAAALLVFVVAGAIITNALTSGDDTPAAPPPPAHPGYSVTQANYLDALAAAGIGVGDADAIDTGGTICDALDSGYQRSYIVSTLIGNSSSRHGSEGISSTQAQATITAANKYLCPGIH